MTSIKICGITNRADAETAIALGADTLGFNGVPGTKRYIDLLASDWIARLPDHVLRVAVLLDPAADHVLRLLALPCFDLIQLHGSETPEFCQVLPAPACLIKALPLRTPADLDQFPRYPGHLLIDSHTPGQPGGTGHTADWTLAAQAVRAHPKRKIYLAGGLTPENVAAAIRQVRPFGVDVAGGVETPGDPRRKDPARLAAFITAARSANTN